MVIKVCVGSACYIKGSHNIINSLENLIKDNNLTEQVELKASFCLEHCTKAVAVQVDEDFFAVDTNEVEDFFNNNIKWRL